MFWYLERTLTFTCHLQNGSAFAFLHLLNTILGLWIFNAYSRYFVTECEWFGFCRWTSPYVGIFAPWIYFLCPDTRDIFNMRDWIAPSSGMTCLVFLFLSLSLFLLTGLLKYWVCVCCFVLFVWVDVVFVMLCVKINKKLLITKNIYNPKSEKVGTVWKTQIKKESSDF